MAGEIGFMWRWGTCPRCGAAAWIDAHDDANAACSKQCGFSIWAYLESEYAWEQAHGAAGFAHLFDDRGPRATGDAMNPPERENDVAPLYGSGEELIQRAGVIRYLTERARARELEGEHLAAAGELELAARVCASIAPKLRAAARHARACDRPRRRSWWEGVSRLR